MNRHNPTFEGNDQNTFEMDDTLVERGGEQPSQPPIQKSLLPGVARHTLGLCLLLFVVLLWTTSNFLGSSIFADDTYAKPFFLTYLNTSCFILCIIPRLLSNAFRHRQRGTLSETLRSTFTIRTLKSLARRDNTRGYVPVDEEDSFLKPNGSQQPATSHADSEQHLGLIPTARASLAFCILWFCANYFAMACLQFTTVASTTILTSTASVWTLIFGAITRTEKFTWKKLCGVLASLVGIALISQVDFKTTDAGSKDAATKRAIDEFPDKPASELALGDALALFSAVIYGVYTIVLKRTTMSAAPKSLHMPTFFGFIGIFNVILLFPLFPILHYTGLEPFQLPPTRQVWTILFINACSSLLGDIAWAYAMVLTSPLVVTVGMSLTIPFSLIGEMIIQGRFESWIYWIGAMIVVGSFVFVEREEVHEEQEEQGGFIQRRVEDEEDIGEPGPAILVEDYDEMLEDSSMQQHIGSGLRDLLVDDDRDENAGHASPIR